MTSTESATQTFFASFTGRAMLPGQPDYDRSRAVWNGVFDRKPAVIAACATAAEVADAVAFARRCGLEIAGRGGGHNYAGHAVCDDGLMIHLGEMNGVGVDPDKGRALCGGGATWADVDAATQKHGLATPGGFISHTGIAVLTLGGGIGWLTKLAGLSCDNLISAEVVTADARIVRASRAENPDLFWALRGGGGNYGVVTSFEFALHPVGPLVNLGLFFFGLDRGAEALRFARDYIAKLPPYASSFLGVALSAPPAPFVPPEHQGKTGHALLVASFRSPEEHARVVAPIREAVPPLFELVTPIPFVALQQMFNESAVWGTLAYEKALYLDELSDGVIDVIGEHAPKKSSALSFCPTFSLDGAYLNVSDGDSAFGGTRAKGFLFNISAHAPVRDVYQSDREWVRTFWDAMRPHARGSGCYVNFMAESDEDRVKASYGAEKYARLARIKATWDPENLFHRNVNIKPA